MGELFVQPFHWATKATLHQRMESATGWLGLAIRFLEDWGGLVERTGREKRRFSGNFPSWWLGENMERVSQLTHCCPWINLYLNSDFWVLLYWNNLIFATSGDQHMAWLNHTRAVDLPCCRHYRCSGLLNLSPQAAHTYFPVCGGESLAVFQHNPWLQNATGVSCPIARLCPHFPLCRPPPDSLPGPPTQARSAALKPGQGSGFYCCCHHCKCQEAWQCTTSVLYPAVLSSNSEPPLATGGAVLSHVASQQHMDFSHWFPNISSSDTHSPPSTPCEQSQWTPPHPHSVPAQSNIITAADYPRNSSTYADSIIRYGKTLWNY